MTGYVQRLVDRAVGDAPHPVRPRARSRFEPQPPGPAEVPALWGPASSPPSEEELRSGDLLPGTAPADGEGAVREEGDPAPAPAPEASGRVAAAPEGPPPPELPPETPPAGGTGRGATPHGAAAPPTAPGSATAARPAPDAPPPLDGTSAPHRTDAAAARPVPGAREHDARPAARDVTAGTRHAAAGQPARAHPRASAGAVAPAPPEPAAVEEDRQEPHRPGAHPGTSPWAEDLSSPASEEPAVTVRIGRIVVPAPALRRDAGPRRPAVALPPLAEYLREGRPR